MAPELYRVASTELRLRAVAHAAGILVLAFAAGIGLFAVLANGLALAGLRLSPESVTATVLTSLAQFSAFLIVALLYLRSREEPLVEWRWPTLRQIGLIVGGFVGLYLLNLLAGIVITVLGIESATNRIVTLGNEDPEIFLYMIPITMLLVAPGEELIFRGIIQGWFRRAYGVVPGILLASGIFGAIHLVALDGSGAWVYVSVAAMLGIILGTLYEYTKNIVVPIVVHGLYNALLFTLQFLVASGYVTVPT